MIIQGHFILNFKLTFKAIYIIKNNATVRSVNFIKIIFLRFNIINWQF